ncbi:hypothetical protein ON010_g18993 [Phytophthora cinnamomi]|nr:hypothetical protein ON010_g18993 [Phytophthora cinnamomi]
MAILELQRRQVRADRFMVTTPTETKRPAEDELSTKRQKTWWKPPFSQEQITGLTHNLVTTDAFHDFLVGVTGDLNVTIPSRKTYNDIMESLRHFLEGYIGFIRRRVPRVGRDSVYDCGARPVDQQFEKQYCGCIGSKNNDGHDSEGVAEGMDEQFKARYGMDTKKMVRFTISDTAPAARKVTRQFDTTVVRQTAR